LIVFEKVYKSEYRIQRNEREDISVRPSWKRIVERNPGDKGGRDEFVRRGPKAETVSGKKQRLKIRKTYMMGMKVERTGIGGQGEVFGSVYVEKRG
jgi:hypothetical protein